MQANIECYWRSWFKNGSSQPDNNKNIQKLSIRVAVGALLLTAFSTQDAALYARDNDRHGADSRSERRAERQEQSLRNQGKNQQNWTRAQRQSLQQAQSQAQWQRNHLNEKQRRAESAWRRSDSNWDRDTNRDFERSRRLAENQRRSTHVQTWPNRWDYRLDNRDRYKAYRNYRSNWTAQRKYLNDNLRRFDQISHLNQLQQQQLENQMRAAWLSYHNNQWNGPYGWNTYSDPMFLDYLRSNNSGLLNSLLSSVGMGMGDDYLYSSVWGDERSQLSAGMENIHRLALQGRITPAQERDLMNRLQAEFLSYHNNQWNGPYTWSQYADPSFLDYLKNSRPSLLSTVRDLLVR